MIPSQSHNNEEIHIGLSWSEGSGKYKLTKVITLSPRFILRNNSSEAIIFREHASVPRGRATLQPGERTPLHFLRMGDAKMLTLAFTDSNAQWYDHIRTRTMQSLPVLQVAALECRRHRDRSFPAQKPYKQSYPATTRRCEAWRLYHLHRDI